MKEEEEEEVAESNVSRGCSPEVLHHGRPLVDEGKSYKGQ